MEKLVRYINTKNQELLNSDYSFKSLFEIIYNQDDRIFGEYLDNFRIVKVSYKEMKEYILKVASFLSSKIDDEVGSFVGLYLENSLNWIACFWALLMIGYKPVLLNTRLPLNVNNNVIDVLGVYTIITSQHSFEGKKEIISPNTNCFLEDALSFDLYGADRRWENEIALTTTATSLNYKICVYNGRDITNQVLNAKDIIKRNAMIKEHYQGSLKVLAFLPFYHIFGLIAAYFWFSVFGRTFVFLRNYSSETILKTIERHNVTHVFAVPLLWNSIAREIKKKIYSLPEKEVEKINKWLSRSIKIQNVFPKLGMRFARKIFKEIINQTLGNSIKFLISGGGYISEETLQMINGIGYPLFNGYGATEIGITSVELRKKAKYRLSGSVGRPFNSVKYDIKDDILLVKGSSTCSNIIDSLGNRKDINKEEWFETNDIVSRDAHGYYYINGRMDDVYTSPNGEKYNPDLIEKECLLTTVTNYSILEYNKELILVIQVDNNDNKIVRFKIKNEVDSIVNNLHAKGYPISSIYYTIDPIANVNAIKVSRALLKRNIDSGFVRLMPFNNICSSLDNEEIIDDVDKRVIAIFAEVLGKEIKDIGINSHFIFDLGGTSLDYFTLLMKLKNEFNIDFNFENQSCSSVKEFSNYIIDNTKEVIKNEKI